MAWVLRSFHDNSTLVDELSVGIAQILQEAIAQRGRASLAVSGGSTPRTLFESLSALDIPWQHVVVTLVDERWVGEDDSASNARLVRNSLLKGYAAAARFVGLKTLDDDPFRAVAQVDRRLREEVLGAGAFLDAAILGMGEDGHVASFLPGAQGLAEALSAQPAYHCCGIRPPPPALPRMTMTLDTLLQARHLLLHFIGPDKRAVLQSATLAGAVEELPVRAVLHHNRRPLEIFYSEQQ